MTLQLTPGQSSFDWGELPEPGPDSGEFLQPPAHPTPTEKKVGFISNYFRTFETPSTHIHHSLTSSGDHKNREVNLETLELFDGNRG